MMQRWHLPLLLGIVQGWCCCSLVPLLGFRLCGCDYEVNKRKGCTGVSNATSLNRNVDELEEAIHLLGAEFDLDHAAEVSATTTGSATLTTGSATLTGGGTGTHGNGGAITGGLIWSLICCVTFASMAVLSTPLA